MRHVLALLGWVLLSFAAAIPGAAWPPGEWYQGLEKPAWTPPPAVFPIVWSTLYLLMGIAAWRVASSSREGRLVRPALAWFLVQLLLNASWSPIFFGAHQMLLALAVIALLWIAIGMTLRAFRKVSPAAGWMLVPYLVWVTVATALNFQLWRLNS